MHARTHIHKHTHTDTASHTSTACTCPKRHVLHSLDKESMASSCSTIWLWVEKSQKVPLMSLHVQGWRRASYSPLLEFNHATAWYRLQMLDTCVLAKDLEAGQVNLHMCTIKGGGATQKFATSFGPNNLWPSLGSIQTDLSPCKCPSAHA